MSRRKKRFYFNLFGICAVIFWLLMLGALVKKVHFKSSANASSYAQASKSISSLQRDWREIYLKDKKVGYAVSSIKPFENGYFIQEENILRVNLMDFGGSLYTLTQCKVDRNFFLQSFYLLMSSGVVRFSLSGKVQAGVLIIATGKGKEKKIHKIRLKTRPMIEIGVPYFLKTQKFKVGNSFTFPVFDPSSMSQKELVVKVTGKENLRINRITYNAFLLETHMWGKTLHIWVDKNGSILKEEGFMGLTVVKSSAARAPENLERDKGIDLYEIAAISPDRKLPNPSHLGFLKLKIEGVDTESFPAKALNSVRQKFNNGVLEIKREALPVSAPYTVPFVDPPPWLDPYLKPEFNIESDNGKIKEKALEIRGEDQNPISVSRKLMGWVYRNLEKRPVLSIPSALEALRTRIGDCNEHATLLTALLRASGIPARLAVGLVYVHDRFYYHAWTEAYLGKWVSIDPTLDQMPADATHIKLLEGNLEKQAEIAGLIGEIKLKVLGFGYD
ncbi:MAG: hypothetical protein DRH11_09210 [Deltaproteobacteria bacterium]|nr:MAG: hypothetical protein DRH11_09210 [Deltaproteobacteria bacterium]